MDKSLTLQSVGRRTADAAWAVFGLRSAERSSRSYRTHGTF
jgi:hypothetical protein